MSTATKTRLAETIRKHERDLLDNWMDRQLAATTMRRDRIGEDELKDQSRRFLSLLATSYRGGRLELQSPAWAEMRELLAGLSRSRALLGFSPSETAMFVLSIKQPLFDRLRRELADDPVALADELWTTTELLDELGLYCMEVFQKGREELIQQQQEEMMELSTPVVQLWDGILGLPLIGTLDSQRTQVVMENLLKEIVATGAGLAIIDITGVPTVDTLVAQHLLKTISAARLMGAECIISGIRPQIAQTIVHLGVDLQGVITKSTLSDAFAIALKRRGLSVVRDPHAKGVTDAPAASSVNSH